MNVQEYRSWLHAFRDSVPGWASVVDDDDEDARALRRQWYEDVFSLFELDCCLELNRRLALVSELMGSVTIEGLPSIFVKMLNQIVAEEPAKQRAQHVELVEHVVQNAVLGSMIKYVQERMVAFRKLDQEATPELISRWAKEASERYDHVPDPHPMIPPRCNHCRDTGVIGYRDNHGCYFAGACPACERGRKLHQQRMDAGKPIRFVPLSARMADASRG
jgi:hypothetical protein